MGFGPLPGAPDSSVVLIDGPWRHRTVRELTLPDWAPYRGGSVILALIERTDGGLPP